ncbi:MAG: hypothetical protein D6791_18165 [Chloroflexi bacterium]|nr:MAG: hypothetical protein D6791_18165 [Chloroflexota bacterium]
MVGLVETDQVTIYIGLNQALFVFSTSQWCPRCGRPSRLFQHINGHTCCIGCNGSDPAEDSMTTDIVLSITNGM